MQPQLTPFDGVLLVDKPAGMTSHDVVDRVRRHFGFKKVGHCGTLDPAATGLLILVIERATKLQDRLMSDDKTYEGTMLLGVSTDSQDADGAVIAEKPVPPLTEEDIDRAFAKFRGDLQQVPPMVSAVKHQGTPLYKLARKGKTVEREPRFVHIYDLRVLGLELPRVRLRVACTKGTYVRTLCSDIGDVLGCGAHLYELRRLRSGDFDVKDAHSLETILEQTREQLKTFIIPILKFIGSECGVMQVFRTFEELATHSHKVCLAIGVFDGVHLGHQRVIGQAQADARATDGTSVVLTFDPHPMRVLQPQKAPLLLTSTEHKLSLMEKLGANACLLLPFDKPFSLTPPERFIDTVARQTNQLQEICVGTRFRFGHDRSGDVRLMEALAPKYGFVAKEIKSVTVDDEMISSTAIRQHVLNGRLDRAAAMLGRPFSILGTVEPGDHRGRELGFPTANLNPHNEVLPPDGVYAVRVAIAAEQFGGVVNVGVRPTFAGSQPRRVLEVHILDFARELYGQDVEVLFVSKLRDEQKFASVEALKTQIAADVHAARKLLA